MTQPENSGDIVIHPEPATLGADQDTDSDTTIEGQH